MKDLLRITIVIFLLSSCTKSSLLVEFNCDNKYFKDLEKVTDVKNLFSVEIPNNWKTNLFYDDLQSSIYTADTTKQLTETILLDITFINKQIRFNDNFQLKVEQENLYKKLIQTKKVIKTFKSKLTFIAVSKGRKEKYNYKKIEAYIKINEDNFILAKAEIYGDSLVKERTCKAINILNKIDINQL